MRDSASDFLARSLSDEGRTRQSSGRSSIIDLIDERFIKRNVDPHGPASIGEQRDREQHSPSFNGSLDIFIAQDCIGSSRQRHLPARALQRFRMLAKSGSCIRDSLFQSLTRREASFDVWKPDTKGAVGIFLYDCYIVRHCFEAFSHLRSRTPAGQLVDSTYESRRQIPSRMRHGDDLFPFGFSQAQ
jgi:hypothetical protein